MCPVCLSVTLMYCGHTVGWIQMPLGTEVGHAFQREADILNICCNVLALQCLSALFATMFYLNVCNNNAGVQAYMTYLTLVFACCISHNKALYRYPSRDTDESDLLLLQIYEGKGVRKFIKMQPGLTKLLQKYNGAVF